MSDLIHRLKARAELWIGYPHLDIDIELEAASALREQQAEITRLQTLVRLTRRQLWRAENDNNPFGDDDEMPAAWKELTEKLIRDCHTPVAAAKAEGGK